MKDKSRGGRPPIDPRAAEAWTAQRSKIDLRKLATDLGLSRESVVMWKRVPAERAAAVSRLTGVPLETLRPDLVTTTEPRDPWAVFR